MLFRSPRGIGIDEDNYLLLIFDRWGHKVYESTNYSEGWDGRINESNKVGPQGVYVWKVITGDIKGTDKRHEYVGHVTLVK